jgi:quercetin dioxygenase-like cupin family protein
MNLRRACLASSLAFFGVGGIAAEEPAQSHKTTAAEHDPQFVHCVPSAQRAGRKLGCFVVATQVLGKLSEAPVYWHLLEYSSRVAAEAAAKPSGGTVVESFGKVWVMKVADARWNPHGGRRIARIGPLPVNAAESHTAVYMEAAFVPGMRSAVHRHPGPEAWYVLAGEQCLETPGHKHVMRAGESGIVEEGLPMMLVGTGHTERRSLVLILHDSSKPMTLPADDWKSEGRCTSG